MLLHGNNHTYTVLAKLPEAAGKGQQLLAKDEADSLCLVLTIDDPELVRELAPLFLSFQERTPFRDFIEGFSAAGRFYAVFAHRIARGDQPLAAMLTDTPPVVRVEALRRLVGGLMIQEMPPAVICDVLRRENLFYSPGGEVKFVYDLDLKAGYGQGNCQTKMQLLLAEVVHRLFPDVKTPGLGSFIDQLEGWRFASVEEIYAAFAGIADEVAAAPIITEAQPSLRERIALVWERLAPGLPPATAAAMLAAGFFFLGWMFYHTVLYPPPVDNGITKIGTEEIFDEQISEQ